MGDYLNILKQYHTHKPYLGPADSKKKKSLRFVCLFSDWFASANRNGSTTEPDGLYQLFENRPSGQPNHWDPLWQTIKTCSTFLDTVVCVMLWLVSNANTVCTLDNTTPRSRSCYVHYVRLIVPNTTLVRWSDTKSEKSQCCWTLYRHSWNASSNQNVWLESYLSIFITWGLQILDMYRYWKFFMLHSTPYLGIILRRQLSISIHLCSDFVL